MNTKIWLSSPHMGNNEKQYVIEAFDTNWIAPLGPNVTGFEEDIRSYLQEDTHVAALNSGTAALHLALVILGIKPGDEVICQTMTFSASANPIMYLGATPIFIDSEEATWNMSPAFLELAIRDCVRRGKRPKAIIVVHLYGMPANLDEIVAISKQYGVPLIEDAAEALGSTYNGQKLGTFGDIGIFSFNGNKIITTSGGGALVSSNEDYVKKARFLSTQALDAAPHYQHSQIGYNYRMSNVCAGIGRGQMELLPLRVNQRRNNFQFYKEALSNVPGIYCAEEPSSKYYSNHWLTVILIEGNRFLKEKIWRKMAEENIDCRPLWKPMHLQPVFTGTPYYGNNTSYGLFETGLCLPSGSNLSSCELQRVVNCITEVAGVSDKIEQHIVSEVLI